MKLTLDDATHYPPKCRHGAGVDKGIETALHGENHRCPRDRRVKCTSHQAADADRKQTRKIHEHDESHSLGHSHVVTVDL